MASGTCASASTTFARISWVRARISCSTATAAARSHFRLGLRDPLVGFGLLRLEFRADVFAHIDIGDIDRQNFEGRSAVRDLSPGRFRNPIGIFKSILIGSGRSNRADDSFADAMR